MLGNGTVESPYIIQTHQDLNSVRNNLTATYELGNDIDMSSFGLFTPISYYDESNWVNGFSGNFNGNGYRIKNLTINKSKGIYMGLFGQFFFGTIQNVGLENVQIEGSNCRYIGALIGHSYQATIKNCYSINGNITSQDESGGLLGKIENCIVQNCYTNNNITLKTAYYGGGFVGSVDSNSTLTNCHSSGRVSYTQSSTYNGRSGFAGFIRENSNVTFNNCFYDKETSTQPTSPMSGINPKTTNEMKQQSTFTNWDFTNTWVMNNDYPTLRVFGIPIVAKKQTVNVISSINPITSKLSKSKKLTSQAYAFMNSLKTDSKRYTATLRFTEGYLSQIETTSVSRSRSVRSGIRNVSAYILPINTRLIKNGNKKHPVLSHISPIDSHINVIYPINDELITSNVSTLENASRVVKMEGVSNTYYIVNPSNVEVMK